MCRWSYCIDRTALQSTGFVATMPPVKTKQLRAFRIDAPLLARLDALCHKRGDMVEIVEEALKRELERRERDARRKGGE